MPLQKTHRMRGWRVGAGVRWRGGGLAGGPPHLKPIRELRNIPRGSSTLAEGHCKGPERERRCDSGADKQAAKCNVAAQREAAPFVLNDTHPLQGGRRGKSIHKRHLSTSTEEERKRSLERVQITETIHSLKIFQN